MGALDGTNALVAMMHREAVGNIYEKSYCQEVRIVRMRHACVTPLRSMRKRLMLQLPLLMELSMPWLIISARRFFPASKADARLAFDSVVSACEYAARN